MISKKFLEEEYVSKQKSVHQIATALHCSDSKVTYWLQKHNLRKRSISEAIYAKHNPRGNPFAFKKPTTNDEWFLYGLGLGLYWGEGNKKNKYSVRLGNTDPDLILKFLEFLKVVYQIDTKKLSYGLQIFSDISKKEAVSFWTKKLNVSSSQFQKVIVTETGKVGTYRHKSLYGVLTIYFSNIKLRDTIVDAIDELRTTS